MPSKTANLTSGSFTATVSAITSAFGDPTRRAVYLFARERETGVTAAQVAEKFDVHPNVARHHLDKLAAGGYLEISVEKVGAKGAGRPSKHYKAVAMRNSSSPYAATISCSHSSARRSPHFPPTKPHGWLKKSVSSTARRWLLVSRATISPLVIARFAPRCRPSPTHSPRTVSPHTPTSAAISCASSTTIARSAKWRSSIR
ncbi:MAG: hypothetical protein EBQ75_06520 [Actinobacteria bacterium]|nr:hypothetical protein [Actinomycetota bacterium]